MRYLYNSYPYLHMIIIFNNWYINLLVLLIFSSFFFYYYKEWKIFLIYLFYLKFFRKVSIYKFWIKTINLNENLWIGTVNIHPVILYIVLIITISNLLTIMNKFQSLIVQYNTLTIMKWLTFTFILGGIWGFQSNSWGYIWSDDIVEWALFLGILFLLIKIHTIHFVQIRWYVSIYFIFLILLFLSVRLNIFTTRHSFITTWPMNYKVYFCELIFFHIYIYYYYLPVFNLKHSLINYVFIQFIMYLFIYKYVLVWLMFYCTIYWITLSFTSFLDSNDSNLSFFHIVLFKSLIIWKCFYITLMGFFSLTSQILITPVTVFNKFKYTNFVEFKITFTKLKLLELTTLTSMENLQYINFCLPFLNCLVYVNFLNVILVYFIGLVILIT